MLRTLFTLLILSMSFAAFGDDEEPWLHRGFVPKSSGDTRANSMAMDFVARDYHICHAIENTLVKQIELNVFSSNESCNDANDCIVSSLGGFCPVATSKTRSEAYRVFTRSTVYAQLTNEFNANRCSRPMGMCLPGRATCVMNRDTRVGTCQTTFGNRPTVHPVFMAAPAKAEKTDLKK